MFLDQKIIAQNLGISLKSLRRILHHINYDIPENFKLINNKRCYEEKEILEIIRKSACIQSVRR